MPRAVILTALRVEYLAVRAHLADLREEVHPQGTVYERGQFAGNGAVWDVGIVEIGAGNLGAASETERAISYFNPDVIFFVGVAGGIKDVKLGDVVAAIEVHSYEFGKAETTFQPRTKGRRSDYGLEQRAKAEARKSDWLLRLSPVPNPPPKVFVAPIAAGEKVVTSRQSEVFQLLQAHCGDAIAVEMEGLGFLEAARAHKQVDAIVIRGISDLIEDKGESDKAGYQKIASRHASAFAFEMLAKSVITEAKQYDNYQRSYQFKTRLSKVKPNIRTSILEKFGVNQSSLLERLKLKSFFFDFDVVALDNYGNEFSREKRQTQGFIENFSEDVHLYMVFIPGDKFYMSLTEANSESGSYESSKQLVKIKPFLMGKYPVTQDQWQHVAAHLPQITRPLKQSPSEFQDPNRPVESISWEDAVEFCHRLTEKTGHLYRLPSEAEWEYACRAESDTPFHFGLTITTNLANYDGNYLYQKEHKGLFRRETTIVGSFPAANDFGLYDMHGNVWEWCADRWHNNYSSVPMNERIWNDNVSVEVERVLRGGCWQNAPKRCCCNYRDKNLQSKRSNCVGFRVVLSLNEIL